MKKYDGKTMAKHSRFVGYLKKLEDQVLEEVEDRIDAYVAENKVYCDRGNYKHLSNIFTCMALYGTLISRGAKEETAEKAVFDTMYEYMRGQREKFRKLAGKGWFWPLIKKIVPAGFKKGSGYGWKYTWYKKGEPGSVFRFECNSCIYQQIFRKSGLERFGPKFCYNDIIVYGELPRTDFIRTKTLCRGDDKCDFKFVRYAKDESFERTQSV